jgi:putative colanic acid biosynthesis acetyltransferase WcaB
MSIRELILQDWEVNATRVESQLILAWFRLAQWASTALGPFSWIVTRPYWWTVGVLMGVELPVTTIIGPRLHLYHPHSIVVSPLSKLGSDCHLRQGVTIGNKTNRDGEESGAATLGDGVELGAGCVIIGDIHVGDNARIGALAVVLKSVPAWAVVVGNPGRVIRVDEPTLRSDAVAAVHDS